MGPIKKWGLVILTYCVAGVGVFFIGWSQIPTFALYVLDKLPSKIWVNISLAHSSYMVRAAIAVEIGNFKWTEYASHLEALLNDPNFIVRENSVWALGELKYVNARSKIEILSQSDPAINVRSAAQVALIKMNP